MIKRLQMFCGVEISTLTDNTKKGTPKEKIIAEESLKVSSMIPKNSLVVVLDEKGKEFTSVEFSKVLSSAKDRGETLVFVIGGPFGLSENLKRNAGVLLSLSKMTFTHQMIRLFLLEQIYRGFCILSGKEYHY
jgi:23S rRNA (pseudouridine1915-N3)-methyltransferase